MANRKGRPGLKLTVTVKGKKKTFESIQAAGKFFKIPPTILYARLFVLKWDKKKAVNTKVRKKKFTHTKTPIKKKRK